MSFVIRKHDRFTNETQEFQLVFNNNTILGRKINIDSCCGISDFGIYFYITEGILLLSEDDLQKVDVVVNNKPLIISNRQPKNFLNTVKMAAANYITEQALETL